MLLEQINLKSDNSMDQNLLKLTLNIFKNIHLKLDVDRRKDDDASPTSS